MKRVLIIVFGERSEYVSANFYQILKWALKQKSSEEKCSYDKILVVDKWFNQKSDEEKYGIINVSSEEFQVKPDEYYLLALNFSTKDGVPRTGFVTVLQKLRSSNNYHDEFLIHLSECAPEGIYFPATYKIDEGRILI